MATRPRRRKVAVATDLVSAWLEQTKDDRRYAKFEYRSLSERRPVQKLIRAPKRPQRGLTGARHTQEDRWRATETAARGVVRGRPTLGGREVGRRQSEARRSGDASFQILLPCSQVNV